jgi:hypothetical protein
MNAGGRNDSRYPVWCGDFHTLRYDKMTIEFDIRQMSNFSYMGVNGVTI